MTQTDLFPEPGLEPKHEAIAREKRAQRRSLERVAGSLGHVIIAVVELRLRERRTVLHMEDLVADVRKLRAAKESSVDRVFRDLRQEGSINYRLLNRDASLYELLPTP